MGPSPLGDGKNMSTAGRRLPLPCFNGAVASWRRKDLNLKTGKVAGGLASMGPSPLGDGKHNSDSGHARHRRALQWGRRLLATESWIIDDNIRRFYRMLQWGRRLLATESLQTTP